jgi:transposase-like protein
VIFLIQKQVDIQKLKLHINDFIKDEIYKSRKIECCPSCGGKQYIKHGMYKNIQRYKCKECGKTFSKTTNLLWSYSKKDFNKWIKFVEFTMKRKTLRFCAKKLKINLATAFYWRHKILHGLKNESIPTSKLKGNIHINKTILKENFKGNRKINVKERRNIWIIAAKGNEDSMITMPISNGFFDWKAFDSKVYSRIEEESYIVPYNDRYIQIKAKKHNKEMMKNVKPESRIKYIISNLKRWMDKFKGVATKYLEGYLALFILYNLRRKIDYIDVIMLMKSKKLFIKTNEIGLQQLIM